MNLPKPHPRWHCKNKNAKQKTGEKLALVAPNDFFMGCTPALGRRDETHWQCTTATVTSVVYIQV